MEGDEENDWECIFFFFWPWEGLSSGEMDGMINGLVSFSCYFFFLSCLVLFFLVFFCPFSSLLFLFIPTNGRGHLLVVFQSR